MLLWENNVIKKEPLPSQWFRRRFMPRSLLRLHLLLSLFPGSPSQRRVRALPCCSGFFVLLESEHHHDRGPVRNESRRAETPQRPKLFTSFVYLCFSAAGKRGIRATVIEGIISIPTISAIPIFIIFLDDVRMRQIGSRERR